MVVPHILKSRFLHPAHYSQLSGHLGGAKIYVTLRKSFCLAYGSLLLPCYRETVRKLLNEPREALGEEEADEVISADRAAGMNQH